MATDINNFIKNEPEFLAISNKIKEFNPLKIIGVQEREIRHSKILAWLLNPKGNHNLKDIFLKEFIRKVYLSEQVYEENSILDKELDEIKIITEWTDKTAKKDKIDIVGILHDPKFILVIENKINSSEGDGQLLKYRKMIEEEFPGYFYLPVFLTVTGEKPSVELDWYKTFSHEDIYLILKDIKNRDVSIKINRINEQNRIINFINDYMDVLEELTIPNNSIINKSFKLNEKYPTVIQNLESHSGWFNEQEIEVLEHIRNYVKSLPFINFKKACKSFQTKFSANLTTGGTPKNEIYTDDRFYKSGKEYWFVPALVYNSVNNKLEASNWKSPYSIGYFFKLTDSKLFLHMEIGPVTFIAPSDKANNRDKLLEFIEKDQKGDFNLIKPKKQNTKKWVKLISKDLKITELGNYLEIFKAMEDLYVNEFSEANEQIFNVLDELYS